MSLNDFFYYMGIVGIMKVFGIINRVLFLIKFFYVDELKLLRFFFKVICVEF